MYLVLTLILAPALVIVGILSIGSMLDAMNKKRLPVGFKFLATPLPRHPLSPEDINLLHAIKNHAQKVDNSSSNYEEASKYCHMLDEVIAMNGDSEKLLELQAFRIYLRRKLVE